MKTRIAKIFLILVILCLATSVFVACGEPDGDTTPPAHVHEFTNYISDNNATYESDGTKTAVCNKGCGETDTIVDVGSMLVHSGLSFKTLTVSGTNVSGVFANSVTEFSFLNEIELLGDSKYVLALDIYGMQTVVSKTVSLNTGDNVFYVLETINGELENTYTVTLRRRPTYTVWFNTNGGTSVSSQTIEEGYLASEPTTTRTGYDFVSWDYDFTTPIDSNITINANWIANEYSITLNVNGGNALSQNTQKVTYDTKYTMPILTREGYEFVGWYYENRQITDETGKSLSEYFFAKDIELTAAWNAIFYVSNGKITSLTNYGKSLEEIVILEKIDGVDIVAIGDYAFSSCTSFTSITIPDSVTSIGRRAFSGCESLTSITIPNSVTSIESDAFSGCNSLTYNIKGGLKYLGNKENPYLYLVGVENQYITTVDNIDEKCKIIGYDAFYNCTSLTNVTIPDSVASIGDHAFWGCSSLTSITIPDSVTSIGGCAFYYCTSLTSITIGEGVTYIGYEAFSGCDSLTKVNYLGTIDQWVSIDFEGSYSNPLRNGADLYINGVLQRDITINTEKISGYAFYDYDVLTSVTIGESVTSIGARAFYGCDSLTSVTIPKSVTSIGDEAFYDCDSLTSITIPKSVTSIGSAAFADCYSLTIYCEATSRPSGWDSNWNSSYRPVVWGYKGE